MKMKLEIGGNRSGDGWTDINLSNFDLRLMKELPFDDNSIEKVFSSHCIEHIADRHNEYLFKELARKNISAFKRYGINKIITSCPINYPWVMY